MINPFTLFRVCVVAPVVLVVASIAYSILAEPTFSEDMRDIMSWNGYGGLIDMESEEFSVGMLVFAATVLVFVLLALVNQVLFFFYWRPSRWIYLVSWLLFLPLTLLFGVTILTPLEYLLFECSTFLSGIALALAFYGPVAARFAKPVPPPLPD